MTTRLSFPCFGPHVDLRRVCDSTAMIAKCAQTHIADCIGEQVVQKPVIGSFESIQLTIHMQVGSAAFKEIIYLSRYCCPDRNHPNCTLRGVLICSMSSIRCRRCDF
jgi:hypothetical protein